VEGFCEHGNERLGSIKGGDFLPTFEVTTAVLQKIRSCVVRTEQVGSGAAVGHVNVCLSVSHRKY
jgi:hypothetical protein